MPTINRAKSGLADCYFQKVTVSGVGAAFSGTTQPNIVVNVAGGCNNFSLSNETASSVVEVSFNGTTVQDELDSTLSTRFVEYNNRTINTVWFRLKSGATATVAIRAW